MRRKTADSGWNPYLAGALVGLLAIASVYATTQLMGKTSYLGASTTFVRAAGLLERAGLAGEAKELLTAHLAEALAPYYYTSWLAGLEAREGNPAAAVALYRQAWQGARERSSGAAMTPFRWGSSYLQQLMKLTPEAQTELAADARIVLGDLLASPDAFSHGNWARLQSLAGALTEWQGSDPGRTGVVDAIRAQVAARCGELPATGDDSAAARCRGLFAPAAS